MLNNDDLDFIILFSRLKTLLGVLVFAVVVVATFFGSNKRECLVKSCPGGQSGRLIGRECLCVGLPLNSTDSVINQNGDLK